MSTHHGSHSIRKRPQRNSQRPSHNRHALQQLRLLAPKDKELPETPVQHRIPLGHNHQQAIEGAESVNDVNLQQSATSPLYFPLKPVSSGYGFTSFSPFQPDHTFSNLERTHHAAVAPSTNIYSNRGPSTPTYAGFPEIAAGDLVSRVDTYGSVGPSTQQLSYGNVNHQETINNRHGEDSEAYWIPMHHAPGDVVWTAKAQPAIGVHQNIDQPSDAQQSSDQYPPVSTQQLPPVQLAYPAPVQQNPQHVACVNCPPIWCFHLESITLSDPEDKGITNIRRSYRDLRQHIDEAHQWHYGAACALCENLFCYHLGNMMLLEVAKGDFADVKIDLGSTFMTLRQHIREAHGGC